MARKREEEYDDADDGDQYSDYEDAEEAPVKGPKKKKRKKTMALLDLEAEEDDAEDEEEEEEVPGLIADDDDQDAALDRDREQMRAQRFERQRAMESEDPENLERYFEERYAYHDEDQGAPDTSGVDQQSLLPTIHDPRIFIVKCKKIGHERRAIFSLLQKMFNYQRRGIDLGIFSAIAPQHLKGRVYIEALSSVQVEAAIQGLDLFTTYDGIKPLRLDEMVDVLRIGKRSEKQAVGNWVRLTRGMYKGDLAQVCGVRDGYGEGQVLIRLIPRLDYKGDKEYMDELDKDDGVDDVDVSGTRKKGRPRQKLFDKKELYRLTGSSDIYTQRDRNTGAVYEVWNEELFRYGLLHKWISPRTLTTGDAVQPQVEELEKWMMAEKQMKAELEETNENGEANDEVAKGLNLDISSIAGRRGTKLYKGDSVRVVTGEQKGLSGKIDALREDVVLLRCDDFPEPLSVSRSDVVKVFKSGEPVRIASGQYAGFSGTIVAVDGDFLTVFTDSTRQNIRVVSAQVADASDMNIDYSQQRSGYGGAARQQYELFDLVQMLDDPTEKCVVIQVRNDGVKLLNTRNNSAVHPLSAIKGRVRDLSARAVDSRGFPIAANDSIHVVSGIHKDRQGIVQHVAGSFVFFKARDELKHCGLVAVPASQCTASTAAARRLSSTGQPLQDALSGSLALPRGSISSLGGGGGLGGFGASNGRRRPVRDELYRADVKVKRGPYKGHSGKVVEVSDSTVRVELISKMKTITVQRAWVRRLGDAPNGNANTNSGFGRGRGTSSSRPPLPSNTFAGSRTPRYSQTPRSDGAYRSQTPRLTGFSSATPRYGMATPRGNATPGSSFGAQTPGRDTFGSRTPAHHEPFSYSNAPRTPANPYGSYPTMPTTPGGGVPTRLGSDYPALEPNTPGGPIEPRTPAYQAYEAGTPAPGMEPTTPAPGGAEPRTPAPQYEPRTPATFEPRTPLVQEPSTPHTPAAIPQTPHPQEEPAQTTLGYRVLIDVEVLVRDENNNPGVVVDASPDGSEIVVKMINGEKKGERIRVTDITPVQPRSDAGETQELVKVLDGEHVGKIGRLLGVLADENDNSEGRIKFQNGKEVVLQMALVAKCYEEGK